MASLTPGNGKRLKVGDNSPPGLKIIDIDSDGIEEIFVGLSTKNVQVLNSASPLIRWDSGALDDWICDMSVGDSRRKWYL